jgi:hypothetical protein
MSGLQVEYPFGSFVATGTSEFYPEWDVPSHGKSATDALAREIDLARSNAPGFRNIHLLAGQAGYGKTHLYGRLFNREQKRFQIVFLPAPQKADVHFIPKWIQWEVVETLFTVRDEFSPKATIFAELLAKSFAAYFDQLSPRFQAKCAAVRSDLDKSPTTVLEILGPVSDLGAYGHLADAICAKLPHLPRAVLSAFVYGLSPAADDARSWLRGEADRIPEEQRAALKLPGTSPDVSDVVLVVSELLKLLKMPLVLCFDQLELLFKANEQAFGEMTTLVMGWLQQKLNLVVSIGCFQDAWKLISERGTFAAFLGRVTRHDLEPLRPEEAVQVIASRLKTWTEYDPARPAGWPFDLQSVREFVAKTPPSMRYFIQEAGRLFDRWLSKKREGMISFGSDGPVIVSPKDLISAIWAKELAAVTAEKKAAVNTSDTDLWDGVEEALYVAVQGKHFPPDLTADWQKKPALKATATDRRPSGTLKLTRAGKAASFVVAVSTKDGGPAFTAWFKAMSEALKTPVQGSVVIWPRAELSVGKTTATYKQYQELVNDGKVRPFPLDTNEGVFFQLECLRRLIRRAEANDLSLNGPAISAAECTKLIAEAGLIANLKLFNHLFENWPGLESTATVRPPVVPPSLPVPPISDKGSEPRSPDTTPKPPPVADVPPPEAEPTWAEKTLKKAGDYLKKRGQSVHAIGADLGPTFARLKFELRGEADFAKVRKQSENLKVQLSLQHQPLIASQAGYVSIDVQRPDRETVQLASALQDCPPKFAGEPAFPAGKDVSGRVEWLNLSEPESCHLLVAGTTGSGKSEFLKSMIGGLAARLAPDQLQFWLVDPKRVTFNIDSKSPYLGGPVVYDGEGALPLLQDCEQEMERRYELLQKRGLDHVRHLKGKDAVPRWVFVFDEFADLMTDKSTKKELEPLLRRLGAKARAAGIHLVLGTQRPEASVVTPLLRSNLPGRIGLQVATERESKLFLDEPDAAYLFGKGDLVWKRGGGLVRLQSPFVEKAALDRYLRV